MHVKTNRFLEVLEPRVTLDRAFAATWSGGALVFRVDLTNRTGGPADYALDYEFYLGQDGRLVGAVPVAGALAPFESAKHELVLPVPPGFEALLQGLVLEERVRVKSLGAQDDRRIVYPIP